MLSGDRSYEGRNQDKRNISFRYKPFQTVSFFNQVDERYTRLEASMMILYLY